MQQQNNSKAPHRLSKAQQDIYDYIAEQQAQGSTSYTLRQMADALHYTRSNVAQCVYRLRILGLVEQAGTGSAPQYIVRSKP
jgi:DNA-binding MarR family transcriptional regulator